MAARWVLVTIPPPAVPARVPFCRCKDSKAACGLPLPLFVVVVAAAALAPSATAAVGRSLPVATPPPAGRSLPVAALLFVRHKLTKVSKVLPRLMLVATTLCRAVVPEFVFGTAGAAAAAGRWLVVEAAVANPSTAVRRSLVALLLLPLLLF